MTDDLQRAPGLPSLSPIESRALDLIAGSDDLHAHARTLGLTFEEFTELITESNIRLYLEALRDITWQLKQIHAFTHHQHTLAQLSHIAADGDNDPAVRLRACLTIIKGIPPAPPSSPPAAPPLRQLPRYVARDEASTRRLPPSAGGDHSARWAPSPTRPIRTCVQTPSASEIQGASVDKAAEPLARRPLGDRDAAPPDRPVTESGSASAIEPQAPSQPSGHRSDHQAARVKALRQSAGTAQAVARARSP